MKDAPKPREKAEPCSDLFIKDYSGKDVLFIIHWYLKEQQPLFLYCFSKLIQLFWEFLFLPPHIFLFFCRWNVIILQNISYM